MSDAMLKMVTVKNEITQKIRNQLLPFMVNKEVVQKRLRSQIAEIAVHYRESRLCRSIVRCCSI